jgi:hypothetical protein
MTKKNSNSRLALVVGVQPENFEVSDHRLMKPVCHQQFDNGQLTGSMLVQEIDSVPLGTSRKATYFLPNNIALLLSTSEKALESAKEIYQKYLTNQKYEVDLENLDRDRKAGMNEISSVVCDYLEYIQTAIVFGYTAIEAFVNLSIPDNYEYTATKKTKGIKEIYDKKAIERWLSLKIKINSILVEIYDTPKADKQVWWGHFSNLEKYRNEIIHQKTIDSTEFYKVYFRNSIFEICKSSKKVIHFFHDCHAKQDRTNPIWPWLKNSKGLPINRSYDPQDFKVVGNMYEGIKKKS